MSSEDNNVVGDEAAASSTGRASGRPLDRRDLFKGLASLPVLGTLGWGAWRKRALAEERRNAVLAELGVSGDAPALIDHAQSRPPADRVNLGIIGFGGEGEALMRGGGLRSSRADRRVVPSCDGGSAQRSACRVPAAG